MRLGRLWGLLLLVLTVLLCACDSGGGLPGDEPLVDPITLTGETAPTYTIIRGDNADQGDVDAALLLKKYLSACDIPVDISTDWKDNPVSDYEIVVGTTTRAETDPLYTFDVHECGPEGFFCAVFGQRIYLGGGSPAATIKAVESFLTTYFGYTGDPDAGILNGTGDAAVHSAISGNLLYVEKQSFALSDILVGEHSLRTYRIVPGEGYTSYAFQSVGTMVQDAFYRDFGIYMEVDSKNEQSGPALYLEKDNSARGDFSLREQEGDLYMSVTSENAFVYNWRLFAAALHNGAPAGDDVAFQIEPGDAFAYELGDCVYYSDFGAMGDGKTDDMAAIAATHAFANEFGLAVRANAGATYYIGSWDETAVIKTNTDWTDASFIIDDREVPLDKRHTYVFTVAPSTETYYATDLLTSVSAGQENLGVTFDTPVFLQLTDSNTKRYIRYGMNANEGSDQQDYILVDENGNVDPGTPILWDYTQFSDIRVTPVDTQPLSITGGTFTTIPAYEIAEPNYYTRGIQIRRSNVVLDGMTHYVENENPETGAPYSGILCIDRCANVTVKNCLFTPHKTFYYVKEDGTDFSQGTYDINPSGALNLTFENCSQTIPITDKSYWGVIGSNFCKNMTIKGCSFSRADAHQGVAHMTILDSEIGVHGLQLIGTGTFRIENTTVMGSNFLYLRGDYGSHWDGDFVIRSCTWIPDGGEVINGNRTIIQGGNPETHDFGYECRMPHTIVIDGLHVADANAGENYNDIWLIGNINPEHKDAKSEQAILESGYPIRIPETVTVKNFTSDSGKKWSRPPNSFMFRETEIITD